jgi:hypothetical protein
MPGHAKGHALKILILPRRLPLLMNDIKTSVLSVASFVCLLLTYSHAAFSADVISFMRLNDGLEFEFKNGLLLLETKTQTTLYDRNGFEWTLPPPLRIRDAVTINNGLQVFLLVVRGENDGYRYSFMMKLEKQARGWRVVAPIHSSDTFNAVSQWIDSISVPEAEQEKLAVLVAKVAERSGGIRDIERTWRFWDFELNRPGEMVKGKMLPFTLVQ